ncbi:hypothetical protein CYY_002535 [Polysphondylium violaceum]|uniref:Glycosyltransferase n=1 Tax=Polysphondylium violaceum TaxID=133409 RepID=A0A8J4Q7U0_9MYCE|nr:hypothetical protein CYY_002535 [Polysphondylium violaceum]
MKKLLLFLKRNFISIVIICSLLFHIIVIHKYASFNIHRDQDLVSARQSQQYLKKSNTKDQLVGGVIEKYLYKSDKYLSNYFGNGEKSINYGDNTNFEKTAHLASQHPASIVEMDSNLDTLPSLCSPIDFDQVEQCEGDKYYSPSVVTPTPVLDENKMDYTLKPNSEHRAKFAYQPQDMTQEPIITILTPFYNVGPVILETADAIFGQSLQNFQWILVNDGSPNKTLVEMYLEPFKKKSLTDPRILVVDLPKNKGLPGARNEGLVFAKGKYLIPLDPDDMIENTYLEKAVWFLETHPEYTLTNAWSLGFGYKEYYWKNGFQNGDINMKENMITVATVMRTKVLKEIGGFDANLRTGMEDWDLWMRMANNGHWGHTLQEFHFWYRVSPPGKWASIYNETKFNEFMANQKKKYPVAFTQGVPKLSRPEQEKMESVQDVIPFDNKLKKCRPRLLLLIPHMEVGGADQFNYNFAQGMVQDGWEISIATTRDAPNKWLPQFLRVTPDIFIMPRFSKVTDQTRFLAYLIKSRGFDVVFLSNSEYGYHYLSYLRANAPGPAYVDYTHSETPKWKNGGYARYSAGAEVLLDRAIFASEHLRQYCHKIGHNPNKTATVLIGIDSDKYAPKPENRELVRKELGFPDNVLVIVFVARLESEKQPEVFAEVLKRVDEMGYDFRAISIGDGLLFEDLNATIVKNGLADKVKLLGNIPNSIVSKYVSGSDVFFLPSKVEGISLAIYEAMSQGVCAVSAKVGGQAELVTPDVGYLVIPGTPTEVDEYTEIIADLASNLTHVADLGKKSREKILNGFSVKDTLFRLKEEFCNAAIVSKYTTSLFNNKVVSKLSNEVAILGFEYERASEELLPIWNTLQTTIKQCAPPAVVVGKKIERKPSPYPVHHPEEVLEHLNITTLRVVDDILEEKQKVDRKMKIILKDYQDQYIRRNPRVANKDFKANDFLHPLNADVETWNNILPYPFAQQEYLAYIPNAFIGTGASGTVFDWDRIFLLKKANKQLYTMPSDEYQRCQVIKSKKLVSLIQVYFSYGNFFTEQLPKLSLAYEEINNDPEINILVPNTPYARMTMEELLKFNSSRILYYNPGEGWDPCKVFYAEMLMLPTPIPTGSPPREMMDSMRNIIYEKNNIDIVSKEPTKYVIYSSRAMTWSKKRMVANEQEVIDTIKAHLPKNHELYIWSGDEKLTPELVHIASKARALIGMTGSNLIPMVACRSNTTFIEFMHENPWLTYWSAAESLSLVPWMLPIKGCGHDSESIQVPIEDLVNTLKLALSS